MIETDLDNYFSRYQELMEYIDWTPQDAENVRWIKPVVEPEFPVMVDDFYDAIQRNRNTLKVLTGGQAQINRLKKTLIGWLDQLFTGPYDEEYVTRRLRVGSRHVEIGLDQVFANVSLSRLRNRINTKILKEGPMLLAEGDSPAKLADALSSVNRLIDLDLAVIEDAYQFAHTAHQKKQERYATIGKISGGIAHEIRNPLNVMKTSAYFLEHAGDKVSQEKKDQHISRISKAVEDANRIVTALSEFARLPEPSLNAISIRQIVDDALSQNSGEELELPVKVTLECTLNDDQIYGESGQLLIAFGNLIRNAIQAIQENGEVTIRICEVNGKKSVVIRDNGVGIPREHLSQISDPLFSTKPKGLGLGLAITKAILDSHKAELQVESEPGKGTEFKVLFPIREVQNA